MVFYKEFDEGGGSASVNGILNSSLTPEQQSILDKDPRLQKIASDPNKIKELQSIISRDPQVFQAIDNPETKSTLLKDLGILTIASNGDKFDEFLQKYGDKAIDEAIKKRDGGDWTSAEYRAFVKYRKESNNEALVSVDTANEGKKQALIEWQKKEEIAKIEVGKIEGVLTNTGKKLINIQLQEQKTDPNNPVYRDLISKGIDPSKGEFDNILRASIILANVDILRKESNNPGQFDNSIRELGKLGISYPISKDIPAISTHIDSRFPKGESTERAKGEIKKSIESGNVASLYYDGKGEKYTLIDRDGKTSKEIYMNPPRTQVMRNGLSISRDISPVIETPEEKKKKSIETSIHDATKGLKENPYIGALLGANYVDILAQAEKSKNPKEQLSYSYQGLQQKHEAINKLIQQYEQSGEQSESNAMKRALIQVESQIKQVTILATSYESLLKKETNNPTFSTRDNFDTTARNNLSWLVENKFDRMGSRANEALDRIIGGLNKGRDAQNMIDLSQPLDPQHRADLNSALTKLGGTRDVLTSGDSLPVFQNQINEALRYVSSSPSSIEGILRKTDSAK